MRHLLALLFLAAAPAWAQAPAASVGTGSAHYLWQVSSMTNRIYLFGTVHAGKASWYPFPEVIDKAIEESRVIAVEADITNQEAMTKSAGVMTYTPPDSLEKHVKPADYARFQKLLARYSIPESAMTPLKPFMAVSLLVFSEWGRLGYLPAYGVDLQLLVKARSQQKQIVELEGVAAQIALMESLTEQENSQLFAGTLGALESGLSAEQITGIVNAWQAGDPKLLLDIAGKYNAEVPGAKAFEEKFIWSRHDGMLKKIEGFLASKDKTFVAVGALHLAGERGLIEMLKKRGYVVKQL